MPDHEAGIVLPSSSFSLTPQLVVRMAVSAIEDLRAAMSVEGQVVGFTGWNQEDDCTTAQVLACDDQGMVTSINLAGENKLGSLPSSIGALLQLTSLVLQSNQFSRELPTTLDSLVNLVNLDLSANLFTGTIPSFGSLTALTSLILANNRLAGSLPDCFSNLPSLETIDLSSNQLSGSLPASIDNLEALTWFDVSNNYLSDDRFPVKICTMDQYEEVKIYKNCLDHPCDFYDAQRSSDDCSAFCGISPSSEACSGHGYCYWDGDPEDSAAHAKCVCDAGFPYAEDRVSSLTCKSLVVKYPRPSASCQGYLSCIVLSDAFLPETFPAGISLMTYLKHLGLSRNSFFGPFPEVTGLVQLSYLDISYNYFTGSMPTLTKMSSLVSLSLRNNFISSGIIAGKVCESVKVDVRNNCFAPEDVPCLLEVEQLATCSDFCGMIGSSVPPCAGHGYCFGEGWGEWWGAGQMQCQCFEGYVPGPTHNSCVSMLESSQVQVLEDLLALWGSPRGPWQSETPVSLLRFVVPDSEKFIVSLALRSNYLYGGSLPTTMCTSSSSSPLTLSLHDNCFPSDAVPCALPHAQRPPLQCSAFCSLSPPSTPPCAGRGYCFWEGGEATGTATCVCGEGYDNGADPGTCASLIPQTDCCLCGAMTSAALSVCVRAGSVLESLMAAWGGFDGDGTWKSGMPCERMTFVSCDSTNRIETLSLSNNYFYSGTLFKTICRVALSLHDNCFPSDAVPCALPHAQRPPLQCSAFCSLSPPSTPPCAGRGYCFWEGGEATGTATCVCGEGYGYGVDPGSCITLLPTSEWLVLDALKSAWGGFDGGGTWSESTPCERLKHVKCNDDNHIVAMNVSGQGIAGSIPINIQDLLHVTLLDLSHNQLSGKLPSGLSRLQGLLTLSLRSNYLYGGALPTSMCASSSSPLALSLHDNCFPSDAVPCALPHAQP
ncbi:unnamed protein product, partial [Closterium sp. NIES-65]